MGYQSDVVIAVAMASKENMDELLSVYALNMYVQKNNLLPEWVWVSIKAHGLPCTQQNMSSGMTATMMLKVSLHYPNLQRRSGRSVACHMLTGLYVWAKSMRT